MSNTNANTIKVLTLSNGTLEEKFIPDTLEALQQIVGGYIEIPYIGRFFAENEIDMIVNDEGKLIEGMKPEIAFVDSTNGKIMDIVFGNCIFASHDDEGNTTSLNAVQMEIVKNELETVIELMNSKTLETFEVRAMFI